MRKLPMQIVSFALIGVMSFCGLNDVRAYATSLKFPVMAPYNRINDFADIVMSTRDIDTPIYNIADANSSIVGFLPKYAIGSILNTVDRGGETWYQIDSADIFGYVKGSNIVTGIDASVVSNTVCDKIATVDAITANLYSKASDESKLVSVLSNGQTMKVLSFKDNFIKVEIDEKLHGYINGDYVSVSIGFTGAKKADVSTSSYKTIIALPNYSHVELTTPYDKVFQDVGSKYGISDKLLKSIAVNVSGKRDAINPDNIMGLSASIAEKYSCVDLSDPVSNVSCVAEYISKCMANSDNNIEVCLNLFYTEFFNNDTEVEYSEERITGLITDTLSNYYGLEDEGGITEFSYESEGEPYDIVTMELGNILSLYACQFVGGSYVWGGEDLYQGVDCSGFVQQIYKRFGYELPHSSLKLRDVGISVSDTWNEALAQPGDIICYNGHVAIYIGNNSIVHAASERSGIKITKKVDYMNVVAVRRVLH